MLESDPDNKVSHVLHHGERELASPLVYIGISPWSLKLFRSTRAGDLSLGLWGVSSSARHPSLKRMTACSFPCLSLRMKFEDFKVHFDKVEICNLTPDALEDNTAHKWEVTIHQGSWVRGSTAGGCRNFLGK